MAARQRQGRSITCSDASSEGIPGKEFRKNLEREIKDLTARTLRSARFKFLAESGQKDLDKDTLEDPYSQAAVMSVVEGMLFVYYL